MTKEYVLETELKRKLDIAKANHYLINGKDSSESEIEKKVRNGSVVISQQQAINFLTYIAPGKKEPTLESICGKIAKDLGITGSEKIKYSESTKVLEMLSRNKLISYQKEENRYALTRKGKCLKSSKRKGNRK